MIPSCFRHFSSILLLSRQNAKRGPDKLILAYLSSLPYCWFLLCRYTCITFVILWTHQILGAFTHSALYLEISTGRVLLNSQSQMEITYSGRTSLTTQSKSGPLCFLGSTNNNLYLSICLHGYLDSTIKRALQWHSVLFMIMYMVSTMVTRT